LLLTLAIIAVTASATQVLTQQRRLVSVADAAAAAGLERFDTTGRGNPGHALRLDADAARSETLRFLARTGASERFDGLRVDSVTVEPDGVTVTVRLEAGVAPALTAGLLPWRVGVEATGRARLGLSR